MALVACAPAPPNVDDFGVPSHIGGWNVELARTPAEGEGEVVAAFFEAAEGDASPPSSVWARVLVTKEDSPWPLRIQAFRSVGAQPAAMWKRAEAVLFPAGGTPVRLSLSGWEVARFDLGGGNAGPPTWIAVQRDRLFYLGPMSSDDARTFLAALD